MRSRRRDVILGRSDSELDSGLVCAWSDGAPLARSSCRSSPHSLPGSPEISTCCDSFVRNCRSVVFWLGDKTDSASEKQAGNSSFRKFVGGPYNH